MSVVSNIAKTIAISGLAVLTACNSDGTIGQRGSAAWYAWSSPVEKKAYFTEVCTGYGFRQGTPELAQCLANENRGAAANRQAVAASIAASGPRTCSSFGTSVTCF